MPVHHRTFPGLPGEIKNARRFAAQHLDGSPAAEEACLMISELATNALLHTRSGRPGGHFTIKLETDGEHARVEVRDEGSRNGEVPHGTPDSLEAESGRGLVVVQALADRFGTERPNTVWFELSWVRPARGG